MNNGPLSAPHTRAVDTVPKVMLTVWLALLPASLFGIYLFGWPALWLLLVTVASALLTEWLALWMAGKPVRPYMTDGSALLTAWLLAMSLPPWAPWWIGAVGGFFAILVGKHVFGGIGQNLFNPAMLARVVLLISFPLQLTQWPVQAPLFSDKAPGLFESLSITFGSFADYDSVTGATILGHVKTELGRDMPLGDALAGQYDVASQTFGMMGGSLGETSALLLLLGGVFLLWRGIITWAVPVSMLASVALLAGLFHLVNPEHYAGPLYHLLSGGVVLGAFFIATDPVGSPATLRGQLVFGAGCGLLTWLIRTYGGYPEGVAFAVLLMNSATPLIDHYMRPRIYGRTRDGAPRSYDSAATKETKA